MNLEDKIKELLERIKGLEARISQLEMAHPYNPIPYQPYSPPHPDIVPYPYKAKSQCPVCGMDWSGPMGYVCYNPNCPSKTYSISDAPVYSKGTSL